jgi:hypothetical protein
MRVYLESYKKKTWLLVNSTHWATAKKKKKTHWATEEHA